MIMIIIGRNSIRVHWGGKGRKGEKNKYVPQIETYGAYTDVVKTWLSRSERT